MKVSVHLLIDEEKWLFLAPILERYVVQEQEMKNDKELVDYEAIRKLCQGKRITDTLLDLDIHTVGELRRLTYNEFCRHRNAGNLSWSILQDYINDKWKNYKE